MKNGYQMDVMAKFLHHVLDVEDAHQIDRTMAGTIAGLADKEQEPGTATMLADGLPPGSYRPQA